MANEPTRVDLLDRNQQVLFSVTASEAGSLNNQNSESTRYLRIVGPAGSTVTSYDDQMFRVDQNAVTITKTVDSDVVVPIATDFVSGDLQNGVYSGAGNGYQWLLHKCVETNWWAPYLAEGIDALVSALVAAAGADSSTVMEIHLATDTVLGFIFPKNTNHSTNNHTDNLSSIALGMPLPDPQN